jgi:SAM-dependent methyltransferase
MATDTNDYLFDNEAKQAGDRFSALASLFDPVTVRHLDEVGTSAGQRCWEVGAGGGTVARWMADRVGPSGFVLATDLDVQWLEHDLQAPNVQVSRHDVLKDATPSEEFDLVHERLVLLHIADRTTAVERMASALRPGGWMLLEDFDADIGDGGFVDAASDVADLGRSIASAIRALLRTRGADTELGSKLPHLLRRVGFVDIRADAYKVIEHDDMPRDLIRANIVQVRDQLVDRGLATESAIDRYLQRLDDGTLRLTSPTLVSAWGRRPPA